jgi:uncharacterized protein YllA (UPF0747 family)
MLRDFKFDFCSRVPENRYMQNLTQGIKFRDLPGFSRLFVDWIEGTGSAPESLPSRPEIGALRGWAQELKNRSFNRPDLHRVLTSQAVSHKAGTLAMVNIEKILRPDSVVLAASLPPVFAGGPLELLLKCFTVAKLAAHMEGAGVPAVPLCWLNRDARQQAKSTSVVMLDPEGELHRMDLGASAEGSDWPIPENIRSCFAEMESSLGLDPEDPLIRELRRTFAPGIPFSTAALSFFHILVKDLGITLIDPQAPGFRSIAQRSPEGSICRGDWAAYRFIESALPVAGHVIDDIEICEFAPAAAQMAEPGFRPPLLWPRASATLIDSRSHKTMAKYGIGPADLLAGQSDLIERLTRSDSTQEVASRLESLEERIGQTLAEIGGDETSDSSLKELADETRIRMLFQVGKLKDRYTSAVSLRREVIGRQIGRVRKSLVPEGGLQERVLSGLYFLLKNTGDFSHSLYERLDIQSFEHQLLSLE